MSRTAQLRPAQAVETSRVEDRAVLFHRDTGEALVLNPSASLLWARLEMAPGSLEDLAGVLEQSFELSQEQARDDAQDLIDQLQDGDWLVPA